MGNIGEIRNWIEKENEPRKSMEVELTLQKYADDRKAGRNNDKERNVTAIPCKSHQ